MQIYRKRNWILVVVFLLFPMQMSGYAEDPEGVNEIVTRWLVNACELGDEKALIEKVSSLGKPGVMALISAHKAGPPPEVIGSIKKAATRRYRLRQSVLKDPDLLQVDPKAVEQLRGEGEVEFVQRQLDSFVSGYKSQAINGLRQIHDEQAKIYLDSLKVR